MKQQLVQKGLTEILMVLGLALVVIMQLQDLKQVYLKVLVKVVVVLVLKVKCVCC